MQSQARKRAEPLSLQHLLERLAGPQAGGGTAQTAAIDLARPLPAGRYSAVIGPVPFGGVVEARGAGVEVRALARSRRAELLAIAWALLASQDGGRLALVVPESVLEGATQAHHALRRRLVEENALQAVIGLRASLFRPRTRAAILRAFFRGHPEELSGARLRGNFARVQAGDVLLSRAADEPRRAWVVADQGFARRAARSCLPRRAVRLTSHAGSLTSRGRATCTSTPSTSLRSRATTLAW